MKRLMTLLLAAALLVLPTGCGADTEAEEPEREPVAEAEQEVPEEPEKKDEENTDAPSLGDLDLEGLLQDYLGGSDEEPTSTTANDTSTAGEAEALETAQSYLSFMAFSHAGLIEQLEYEGYTTEEATYAADHCGADWKEQAVRSAKQYLEVSAFSYDGLVDQLEYEGYTAEEAAYGVEQAYGSSSQGTAASDGATVGQTNALASAEQYLSFMAFSYTGLIEQLEYEGYSTEEATYAADHCGADWKEQAAKSAEQYLDILSFSRQELIEQLEYDGFTAEQAAYGADQVGY